MAELSRAQELIHKYLDGRAAADELRELTGLLTSDPRVADELAAAAELDSLLERRFREEGQRRDVEKLLGLQAIESGGVRDAAPRDEPEADASGARPEIAFPIGRTEPDPRKARGMPQRSGSVVRATAWLAAFCLLVVVGLAMRHWSDRPARERHVLSGEILIAGRPAVLVPDGAPVVVTGAAPAVVELADGSQAEFSPTSEAVVHGRRGSVREVVELTQGSGIFRVEKGSRRFRVETAAGNVTALGTEFSVELRPTAPQGEADMRAVSSSLTALVVAVVAGSVEVELRTGTVVLSTGDSRVFAAAPDATAAQNEKKLKSAPLPSGDVVGFGGSTGKSGASEKVFPGIVAALLLTDEQRQKINLAREETLGSEAVRNAGASLKGNPNATEEEKAKAQQTVKAAREELRTRVATVLTAEQKALVEKIDQAVEESRQTARQALQAEFADAKTDKAKAQEFERRVSERAASEFKTRAAGFLGPDRLAAMDKAAQERAAAEERAKNAPKKK